MPDGTRPEMHLPASSAIRSNFVDKFLSLRTNSIPFGLPSETFTNPRFCRLSFQVAKSELDDSICKAEIRIAPGAPNALRQRLPPPINTISTTSSSTSQSLNAKHLTP
nr:6652_t:CDS:2 [Entrophospora candida]